MRTGKKSASELWTQHTRNRDGCPGFDSDISVCLDKNIFSIQDELNHTKINTRA